MAFLRNLFGGSIDFPCTTETAAVGFDKEEHVKLLTEICEEPKKMLDYYHRIHDELISQDGGQEEFDSRKEQADQFRKEGNAQFAAGRFTESLACYREAMKLTPNDAKLYSNACLCHMQLGHFEEAVVDGFASVYSDKFWSKSYGMMIAAYCHIGYMDVVNNYVKHALTNFGRDYYNEAMKKINSISKSAFSNPRKMDKADLVATVTRLFQTNHPPRTYAFLLTHIIQHCEWSEDGSVERTLRSLDFVRRVLQVPYLKGLLSPDLNVANLQIDDALVLIFALRLLGAVMITKNDDTIPQTVLSFASSLGTYWTKESTAKLISRDLIPFGHVLFDYYVKLLTTIAACKVSRSRFFKSNRLEWLLHLPVACFTMMNPAQHPEAYFALFRLICLVAIQKWFPDLPQKSPSSDLTRAISLFASLGIICDRLMDYELPYEDVFSDLEIEEAYYLFFKQISHCNDSVIRIFANIPEVWMMYARKLAKCPHSPGDNAYPLMAIERFLSPWAFETDEDMKPPLSHCFEDGPWFDMLLYSFPKLMLPKKMYRDTLISAVWPASRLASASCKFAERLLAQVPILNVLKFFDRCIDDDGAMHYFAIMLSVIDDASLSDLVHNERKKLENVICHVILELSSPEEEYLDGREAEIYHACIVVERLLKIAARLEKSTNSKEVCAGEEIRKIIVKEFNRVYETQSSLVKFFNDLVSWVKGPLSSSSAKSERSSGGRQKKRGAGKKKPVVEEIDEDETSNDYREVKLPSELSSLATHKIFDALSEADPQMAVLIQQVKAKRRQF